MTRNSRARPGQDTGADDRLHTIERLIADVVHDMRTPLQALVIHTEILRRKAGDVAAVLHAVAAVEEETRRLGALLDGLGLLIPTNTAPETFEVDWALGRITPLLQAGLRARYVLAPLGRAGDGSLVRMRTAVFGFVMLRAAFAVRDALPDGGTIHVDTHGEAHAIEIGITGQPLAGGGMHPGPVDGAFTALEPLAAASHGTIAIGRGSTPGRSVGLRLVIARSGRRLTDDSTPA